jgi:YfiH family protein
MDFTTKKEQKWLSFIDNEQIIAGISTRQGGFSQDGFESLNLGINTTDRLETISRNRSRFFSTVAPSMEVIHLNQTHSSIVLNTDDDSFKLLSDGDGLITTTKNKLLTITLADCGSVLFHDDTYSVIGAVHCGWKGTKLGIINSALDMLSRYTDLENIHAYIGPMIRCSSYEVGKEFLEHFSSEYFKESNGKLYLDLNQVIISKLFRANLASITDCGFDTFTEPDLFFSHRRNPQSGRMCAFIGLK